MFCTNKTVLRWRYDLHTRRQHLGEDFDDYLDDLRNLVKQCEYSDQEDFILRDHVVFGIQDSSLQKKLLEIQFLSLTEAVHLCKYNDKEKELLPKLNSESDSSVKLERIKNYSQYETNIIIKPSGPGRVEELYLNVPSVAAVKCEFDESDHEDGPMDHEFKVDRSEFSLPMENLSTQSVSKKLYHCDKCNKVFMFKWKLKRHIASSHTTLTNDEFSHTCQMCSKAFELLEDLERHTKTHIGKETENSQSLFHNCRVCNKSFRSGSSLVNHTRVHSDGRTYQCQQCGKKFATEENRNNHEAIHRKNAIKCKFCSRIFSNNPYLMKHVSKKHSNCISYEAKSENVQIYTSSSEERRFQIAQRKHICKICGKIFFVKQSLASHVLTHSFERPHKCDECDKSFTTKGHLNEHLKIHRHTKSYHCEICKKSFLRKWNFNQHSLLHKGKPEYKCDVCSKTFAVKHYLKKHSMIHFDTTPSVIAQSEKFFFCEPCNKGFTTKQFFERHLAAHEGGTSKSNRYSCSICKKNLSGKRALDNHMVTHTGERPFQCHICSKCFTQKGSLNFHLLRHTGARPHKCQICAKTFPSKDYVIKKHMLIHTGEKPYCCDICGRRFAVKSNLNKHMLIHKNERPHQCDTCKKCFIRKQDLQKHLLLHDRIQQ